MSRFFRFSLLLAVFTVYGVSFVSSDVLADQVYWKDQVSGVSVSYPDRWHKVHNQQPNDVLTVAAPAAAADDNDNAQCRIRVDEDRRFAIHPVRFSGAVQRVHVGLEFWDSYIGNYTRGRINKVQNDAGLGRGHASFINITYKSDTGPKMTRRGLVFASLYGNQLHVFECSSHFQAYAKWEPVFLNILKSVDFRQFAVQKKTGEYRDFLSDRKIRIHGKRRSEDYIF